MAELQYEKKVWGRVAHAFSDDEAAVSVLFLDAGFRCSRHRHRERHNHFFVVSGEITIEEWSSPEYPSSRATQLQKGMSYTVPTGVWHRFTVEQSGVVVEVYYPDCGGTVRLDDIERLDEGGAV